MGRSKNIFCIKKLAILFEKTYLLGMKILVLNILFWGTFSLLHGQNLSNAEKKCQSAILALQEEGFLQAQKLFEQAEQSFEEALKGLAALEQCQCLADWSKALEENGQPQAALEASERAHEQLELLPNSPKKFEQELLLRQARLHYQLQNYISAKNRARTFINNSRQEHNSDHPEQYEAIAIAAHAYLFIDYPETAFKYAERGLKLAKSRGDLNAWRASFLEAMVDSYWQQGKRNKALQILKKEWIPLIKKLYSAESKEMAKAYHLLACYELNQDQFLSAEAALKKSFAIYQQLNIQKGEELLNLQANWFLTHLRQAAFEEAWPHLDAQFQAICLSCEKNEIPASTIALKEFVQQHFFISKRDLITLLHDYQLLYLLEYEMHPAEDLLQKAMGFGETALELGNELWLEEGAIRKDLEAFLEKSIHWQVLVQQKIYEKHQSLETLEQIARLFWKKKELQLKNLLKSGDYSQLDPNLFKKERELEVALVLARRKLRKAYSVNSQERIRVTEQEFNQQKVKLTKLQENIQRNSPIASWGYQRQDDFPSISDLQEGLETHTTHLEYAFLGEVLYAIRLDKKGGGFYELDLEAENLDKYVKDFYNVLYAPTQLKRNPTFLWENYLALGTKGYDLLLKPILKDLDPKTKRLSISADGILHFLSFDALLTKSSTAEMGEYQDLDYLMKNYILNYQYSIHNLLPNSNPPLAQQLSVSIASLGNLDSWKNIAGRRKTQLSSQALDSNQIENSTILCLEGETVWIEDDYGLEIGGDSLNLMDWGKYRLDELQLLVLLGSSSGLGREESSLIDFLRIQQIAGGQAMMANLWPSKDSLNLLLIRDFIKKGTKGQNLSKSWQSLQSNYLKKVKGELAHPYYWAGYKLWAAPSDAVRVKKAIYLPSKKQLGIGLVVLLSTLFIILAILQLRYKGQQNDKKGPLA